MPLVKEHRNLLYKCGYLKFYLGRPWQIISLDNFWDFSQEIWTPLKIKSNPKARKLWNLYFKICADLEVWPMVKVDPLHQIYHHRVYYNFWMAGKSRFPFLKSAVWIGIGKLWKFKRTAGPSRQRLTQLTWARAFNARPGRACACAASRPPLPTAYAMPSRPVGLQGATHPLPLLLHRA
jgi:hypothetical protein